MFFLWVESRCIDAQIISGAGWELDKLEGVRELVCRKIHFFLEHNHFLLRVKGKVRIVVLLD